MRCRGKYLIFLLVRRRLFGKMILKVAEKEDPNIPRPLFSDAINGFLNVREPPNRKLARKAGSMNFIMALNLNPV